MKYLLLIVLSFISTDVYSQQDGYFDEQKRLIQQQKSFAIEDLLLEMDYLNNKVKKGDATKYEKFKLEKLNERLTEIQNGTL